jgi:hypothetical protein
MFYIKCRPFKFVYNLQLDPIRVCKPGPRLYSIASRYKFGSSTHKLQAVESVSLARLFVKSNPLLMGLIIKHITVLHLQG